MMARSKMSWRYIAGFLDADGCITIYDFTRKRTVCDGGRNYKYKYQERRVTINITNTNFIWVQMKQKKNKVLYDIQKFLKKYNIRSSILKCKSNCSCIQFAKKECVYKFLKKIQPFLVVKKDKATLALKCLKEWQKWKS